MIPNAEKAIHLRNFFLQPKDDADAEQHVRDALAYCLEHPAWRLSLQTHKLLGID